MYAIIPDTQPRLRTVKGEKVRVEGAFKRSTRAGRFEKELLRSKIPFKKYQISRDVPKVNTEFMGVPLGNFHDSQDLTVFIMGDRVIK